MERKCANCYRNKKKVDGEIYYCLGYEMNGDVASDCCDYKEARSCMNCANRIYDDWGGAKPCPKWEQLETEEEERETAIACDNYRMFDEDEDEEYCPSATNEDYSPSSPWNAPGMSVRDFI